MNEYYTGEYEFEPDENDDACYVAKLISGCEVLVFPTEYNGARISAVYADECGAKNRDTVKEVIVPEGIKTLSGPLFECFGSLEKISISSTVEEIDAQAISMCKSLADISVSEESKTYKSVGGSLYTKDGKCFVKLAPASASGSCKLPYGVCEIASDAFYGCDGIKSVALPDTLEKIGNNAFWGCKSLTDIKLPRSLISIGGLAFARCEALEKIVIPEYAYEVGYNIFACPNKRLTVLCEASEPAPLWDEDWNADGARVVWSNKA